MGERATFAGELATTPTSVRWRLFGFIFVLTVVNLADRTSISVGLPTIAKEFALSPAMQGVILVPMTAGFILQETGGFDGVLYFFAGCAVLFILGTLLIPFGRLRGE